MKQIFALAILSFLALSTSSHAVTHDDSCSQARSVSKLALKAEHEKECLKNILKKDFNLDVDSIVSTYPTLEQIEQERETLFREGKTKLLGAAADPNKQSAVSIEFKTGIAKINEKKRIAELLEKYNIAIILLENLLKK